VTVDGNWQLVVSTPMGERRATLSLKSEGDTLTGIENVTGSAFDDVLVGSTLANILAGGGGNDTLTGGAGADIFVFDTRFGRDTITDFGTGEGDVVQFDPQMFADFNAVLAASGDKGRPVRRRW